MAAAANNGDVLLDSRDGYCLPVVGDEDFWTTQKGQRWISGEEVMRRPVRNPNVQIFSYVLTESSTK